MLPYLFCAVYCNLIGYANYVTWITWYYNIYLPQGTYLGNQKEKMPLHFLFHLTLQLIHLKLGKMILAFHFHLNRSKTPHLFLQKVFHLPHEIQHNLLFFELVSWIALLVCNYLGHKFTLFKIRRLLSFVD